MDDVESTEHRPAEHCSAPTMAKDKNISYVEVSPRRGCNDYAKVLLGNTHVRTINVDISDHQDQSQQTHVLLQWRSFCETARTLTSLRSVIVCISKDRVTKDDIDLIKLLLKRTRQIDEFKMTCSTDRIIRDESAYADMADVIANHPTLASFKLEGFWFTESPARLLNALATVPNLRSIVISPSTRVPTEVLTFSPSSQVSVVSALSDFSFGGIKQPGGANELQGSCGGQKRTGNNYNRTNLNRSAVQDKVPDSTSKPIQDQRAASASHAMGQGMASQAIDMSAFDKNVIFNKAHHMGDVFDKTIGEGSLGYKFCVHYITSKLLLGGCPTTESVFRELESSGVERWWCHKKETKSVKPLYFQNRHDQAEIRRKISNLKGTLKKKKLGHNPKKRSADAVANGHHSNHNNDETVPPASRLKLAQSGWKYSTGLLC